MTLFPWKWEDPAGKPCFPVCHGYSWSLLLLHYNSYMSLPISRNTFYLEPLLVTPIGIPTFFLISQHTATKSPKNQGKQQKPKNKTPTQQRPGISTKNCNLPKPRCLDTSIKIQLIARTVSPLEPSIYHSRSQEMEYS